MISLTTINIELFFNSTGNFGCELVVLHPTLSMFGKFSVLYGGRNLFDQTWHVKMSLDLNELI
jgi:hypothetical protein